MTSGKFEEALDRDRARLRERLLAIAQNPIVRDAIFVASPNVIERFHLWTEDPESERGRKLEHVLVRYFSRMTGRATPFGLFAGCSVGDIGEQTRLAIAGCASYQRHTRLDMDYLFALTDVLGRDSELRKSFTYRPNSSLYRSAGHVRYVESRLENKVRSYHLVASMKLSISTPSCLSLRRELTFSLLAEALVDEEISLTEAEDYVTQLIDSQILVPQINLPVTGTEPIHPLVDQLSTLEKTAHFAATLDDVRGALNEIDITGLGVTAERYHAVASRLENLPSKPDLSRLFQVDMAKPAPDATLGTAVLEEIIRGVDLLQRMSQPERDQQEALERFRVAFVSRYEQREIPLVEALDEEVGIGFGDSDESSPLLKA